MATSNQDLVQIYKLLDKRLNLAELKTFCFALGIDYDNLGGSSKAGNARELVLQMNRRGKVDELLDMAAADYPDVAWPAPGQAAAAAAPPPAAAPAPRGIQLSGADHDWLVRILSDMAEFQTETGRVEFMQDVLAGSPRKADLMATLNLSGGTPRGKAVSVINRLTRFGQDEPGQEALGVLINKLLSYIGGGADADFLRGLFDRYPLIGTPVSTRGIDDWRATAETDEDVQEKMIGESTLRHIRLLELALVASRSVVRVVTEKGKGSGFLCGTGLLMTNHHVVGDSAEAQLSHYEFNYQLDKALNPLPTQIARAVANGLFYTNAELDVTVIEIQDIPDTILPLKLLPKRVRKDDRVNIIQHPGGHYKKISLQNNFVQFADARDIQYLTHTEPGSSGSPVCNNEFDVVGIHHSGGNLIEPDSSRRFLRNAGSSMIAVCDDLRQNAPEIYQRLNII